MLSLRGQSGAGSDGNEEVLHIPQSFNITRTTPYDALVSFLGHSLGWGPYPSVEKELAYSTAPAKSLCQVLETKYGDQIPMLNFNLHIFLHNDTNLGYVTLKLYQKSSEQI